MNEPYDPSKAVQYILDNALKFAAAKSDRVYLEEFCKSKKAMLMAACGEKTAVAREQYAYAHPEYVQLLEGLRVAVEAEETMKWKLAAAPLSKVVKRKYCAAGLNAQCNLKAPMSSDLVSWEDVAPVGSEAF